MKIWSQIKAGAFRQLDIQQNRIGHVHRNRPQCSLTGTDDLDSDVLVQHQAFGSQFGSA